MDSNILFTGQFVIYKRNLFRHCMIGGHLFSLAFQKEIYY